MSKKYTYLRVCPVCGDSKEVSYNPKKDTLCFKCSVSNNGTKLGNRTKKPENLITYTYFCPRCSSIRTFPYARKTAYCGICSRWSSKQKNLGKGYFDLDSMTYKDIHKIGFWRVCKYCGDEKRVKQRANAGLKCCTKCSHLDQDKKSMIAKRIKTREANGTKTGRIKGKRKVVKAEVSKEAIERAIKINREHKEIVEAQPPLPPKQTKSDNELIAEFLKKNKPSVVADDSIIPHIVGVVQIGSVQTGGLI